jgi:hypothetical protein
MEAVERFFAECPDHGIQVFARRGNEEVCAACVDALIAAGRLPASERVRVLRRAC